MTPNIREVSLEFRNRIIIIVLVIELTTVVSQTECAPLVITILFEDKQLSVFEMEGSLSKWTNLMKGWQFRWFVLDDCAGILSYYLSRDQMVRGERRGCINLKRAVIGIENEDDTTFTITSMMKTYHFQAQDSLDRDAWVRSLEDTILRHAYGSRRRKTIDLNNIMKPQPTIEEFNKKLSEADAYLQLVIDQTQQVSGKMDSLHEFEDQARCSMIVTYANNMLEDAKHTIVLLQIAKHTMDPGNAIPPNRMSSNQSKQENEPNANEPMPTVENLHPEIELPFKLVHSTSDEDFFDAIEVGDLVATPYPKTNSSGEDDGISSKTVSTSNENDDANDSKGAEEIVEVLVYDSTVISPEEKSYDAPTTNNLDCDALPAVEESSELNVRIPSVFSLQEADSLGDIDDMVVKNEVPEESSDPSALKEEESDSENETYDSDSPEEIDLQPEQPTEEQSRVEQTESSIQSSTSPTSQSDQTFQHDDGSLNYDYLYECTEESNVKIECSVVTHLLSQVKIGMDLSKVVLPTFILEKRSLLEMYADFFAHPDLFLRITDQPDAKQRMVEVVRWYITAFHAGRKTTIPKKPYNPILGEVFRCFWDIPGEASEGDVLEGGPVPGCPENKLAFAAEQVSHHPPVSAFYAECPKKRVSCTAYVWTKSKFLGLSIAVVNEGKAQVNFLDHDEQYTLAFPSAYGRSILTKPWFELGGTINILCEKTGYSSKIDFLTKPFYGNKKHRIVGEIFEPDNKKPFLTIEGEWCGTLKARTPEGKEEVFADVENMTVLKKTVRSVAEQECYESRKVWKEVTAGLWLNDIPRATNAKIEVEARQRKEEQTRKENGIEWKTRLFETEATGNWIYRAPLENRIAAIRKIGPAPQ
ncbi:hypothetical protein GE061_014927 [Apolygus lucorum]|uniref:Oxysterol-binding protein n=1 Tax=Apolygus lucorum TaxID=248454 RepID=A0A8S9XJJ0_APOLU|nr:hypothetical protein GE061_014927 [Apolygus lucorum]